MVSSCLSRVRLEILHLSKLASGLMMWPEGQLAGLMATLNSEAWQNLRGHDFEQ